MKSIDRLSEKLLSIRERKIAIHCVNYDEAKELMSLFTRNCIRWCTGDSPEIRSNWDMYGSQTCYVLQRAGIAYSPLSYYQNKEYQIIKFADFKKVRISKKIKWKEVCPVRIYGGSQGWEIPLKDGKIPIGYFIGKGMSRQDKEDIRAYLEGLKILFNRANEDRFTDDVRGNYKDLNEKYSAILKCFTRDDIVKLGKGAAYSLTFYVNGSVTKEFSK